MKTPLSNRQYRLLSNNLMKLEDADMPPQCRTCVKLMMLLQVAYGEGEWIPEPVVYDWINTQFRFFAPTNQEPWRIFKFYAFGNSPLRQFVDVAEAIK